MVAERVAYDYEHSGRQSDQDTPNVANDRMPSPPPQSSPVKRGDDEPILRLLAERSVPLPPGYWETQHRSRAPQIDYASQFRALADEWHRETDHLSSPTQKALHHAYQRIIGIGAPMLPYIYEELAQRGGHWYWALAAITGASPEPGGPNATTREIKDAWLRWGREHHFVQ